MTHHIHVQHYGADFGEPITMGASVTSVPPPSRFNVHCHAHLIALFMASDYTTDLVQLQSCVIGVRINFHCHAHLVGLFFTMALGTTRLSTMNTKLACLAPTHLSVHVTHHSPNHRSTHQH